MNASEPPLYRIIAILKPFVLDAVIEALGPFLASEIEVVECRGYGRQKGHLELYAGTEYELSFLPKVRLEFSVDAERLDQALIQLSEAARTGRIGDGKIFVLPAAYGAPEGARP